MLGLVWAQGHDRAIGAAGAIPWRVPEDMALFKRVTSGCPVIMGRATWESLPERFRPLRGRLNIVVTRQRAYDAAGARVCSSLEEAIACAEAADGPAATWVMGGAQIYAEAMDRADALVVTDIDAEVPDADAFAPEISSEWRIAAAVPARGWATSRGGLRYRVTVYARPGTPTEAIDDVTARIPPE